MLRNFMAFFAALVFTFSFIFSAVCEQLPAEQDFQSSTVPALEQTATDTDLEQAAPRYVIDAINDPSKSCPFPKDAELLEIWFPIIHDCDAALIRCGGENVLIDCASEEQGNRVVKLLELTGTTELTHILNSHPHNDHLLGFQAIASAIKVDQLDICFHEFYTDHIIRVAEEARQMNVPIEHYADGDSWQIGNAKIDVILKRDADWDVNNKSAVMKVTFGDRSILFTGDIQKTAEERLTSVLTNGELKADIIKMPHHGLTRPTDEFRDAVGAELGIITNNSVRVHKTRYLAEVGGTEIVYTVSGYIHLITDGNVWFAELMQEEDFYR